MSTINIQEAKTNLSRLLSRVQLGEEIVIANRGVPVAKLVPIPMKAVQRRASLGMDAGRIVMAEDFNAPLPDDVLGAFEGEGE